MSTPTKTAVKRNKSNTYEVIRVIFFKTSTEQFLFTNYPYLSNEYKESISYKAPFFCTSDTLN